MKRLSLTAISMVFTAFIFAGCQSQSGGSNTSSENLTTHPDSLQTTKDSVSYVLGKNMHRNFQRQGIDINEKLVALALMDAVNGKDTLISEAEAKPIMQQFQQKMMEKRRQQMQQQRQQQGGGPQGQGSGNQSRKEKLKQQLKEKMKKQKQNNQSGGNQ